MATAEIIVYFGFEPDMHVWAEMLAKRLQRPENEDWLHIVEDDVFEIADPKSVSLKHKAPDLDLLRSAHAAVLFLTPGYLHNLGVRDTLVPALGMRSTETPGLIVVPIRTSFGGQEDEFYKSLSVLQDLGLGHDLVPPEGPLDELGEEAEAVLDQIAADLGRQLESLAENDSVGAQSPPDDKAVDVKFDTDGIPPTLAEMILQAAGVEGEITPDGSYLLERAYSLASQQSQDAGSLTSTCLFLTALEWGRRPPGAPSPPHALISLAEAVDAMNPEAIARLRETFLVSDMSSAS